MTNLFPLILEHMYIVAIAIAIATAIGVVLGVISFWYPRLGTFILFAAEMLQTIPSLALLALLMILLGLGNTTLIAGLVLYALLPIVRNTNTGLGGVPDHLREAARGMGMNRMQRLALVELPLSFPMIFSGIKIAVVNSLAIAVMGVLIGAGGLGYPIYRGIQMRSFERIITAALPVVIMAVGFDYLMTGFERRLTKRK
ncbi:ABC transporter permease [Papillibacter cinnamivorans]|uniref:Osmoprotectant transport system permease protein n=1 Tax=Papillibacter cinnamivorans DSM 12816 TaxID=1122930 RepID=A0A1W2CKM0_9FIRM|nr:ABC transporter permease [Papillibacter cinnamivorans]SMC85787.1 osmoprotectant transport system permease protein [Papillibacter cinnamivorans DSM 12816]